MHFLSAWNCLAGGKRLWVSEPSSGLPRDNFFSRTAQNYAVRVPEFVRNPLVSLAHAKTSHQTNGNFWHASDKVRCAPLAGEEYGVIVKTQLTADVLRKPHQLCTAGRSPQALLPKVPPGLNPKAERAFRKLCEALSMAEGTSEALGGWPDRGGEYR